MPTDGAPERAAGDAAMGAAADAAMERLDEWVRTTELPKWTTWASLRADLAALQAERERGQEIEEGLRDQLGMLTWQCEQVEAERAALRERVTVLAGALRATVWLLEAAPAQSSLEREFAKEVRRLLADPAPPEGAAMSAGVQAAMRQLHEAVSCDCPPTFRGEEHRCYNCKALLTVEHALTEREGRIAVTHCERTCATHCPPEAPDGQ